MVRGGILNVRVNQYINVGKKHCDLTTPMRKLGLVILDIKRPRPVEIDTGTGTRPADGYELERRHFSRFATRQCIIHGFGYEGADAEFAGCGCATDPLRKLII